MALSITALGTPVANTNPGSTLVYGSITPTGNEAVLVASLASGVAAGTTPSLDSPTWLSGTWELFEQPDIAIELEAYIGATVASPSADDFTEDFDADALTGGALIAANVIGANLADAVLQSKLVSGTGTSFSVALDVALADPGNAVVAIFGVAVQETIAATDGETIVEQTGYASPVRQLALVYKVGVNDVQLSWTTSGAWECILLEVAAGAAAVDAQAEIAQAAFEVPFVNAQAEISFMEFEVPFANAQAEISFMEFEVPTANAEANIGWMEVEVPFVNAQAEISFMELEVPEFGAPPPDDGGGRRNRTKRYWRVNVTRR